MKTLYGLPHEVRFCTKCTISNQRPNSAVEYKHSADSKKATIHFDEEGVCDACRVAEAKSKTDWNERENELKRLCDRHRSRDGSHDCIVPGSGGKDSYYAAHVLKFKYGMHPLTVTWAPHIYTEWGRRNFDRWTAQQDNYCCTPSRQTHRLLTRLAVENLFHPFQPFMIGQKNLAPKMALLHKIPLVFYGENEAEYGNPITDTHIATRSGEFYSAQIEHEKLLFGGVSVKELKERHKLTTADLSVYMPSHPYDLRIQKVEVHYLGYYLKWKPQEAYYYANENGGFEPLKEHPERTANIIRLMTKSTTSTTGQPTSSLESDGRLMIRARKFVREISTGMKELPWCVVLTVNGLVVSAILSAIIFLSMVSLK